MKGLNQILSYVTLAFFVPAIIGFALIHHYCTGCECQKNETTFIFLTLDSDSKDLCQSCDVTSADSCCSVEKNHENQHGCNDLDSEHEHKSDVNLKKLDEPTTFPSVKPLPNPVEIENMFMISALFLAENDIKIIYDSNYANGPPDFGVKTCNQLLTLNCVFRL
ncbi:hypothetical protein [Natronoflexus pectinivorans]|uniref:Uncharacterized protein n=1 Tax=Natronoflexus pectinivorans TaxID=682526 RepID=A0A4R2GKI7_9BACT|nr:hypothetical protein [Natronoflexus pectinivorans]TCO08736.1 hypothetical protein EV194_10447 [Natronoflexus pectinivorans]